MSVALRTPFGELSLEPATTSNGHVIPLPGSAKPADSQLGQDLQHTLHPEKEKREGATAALKAAEAKEGFCVELLDIICQPDAAIACRLSGATYLKNFVKKNWDVQDDAAHENNAVLEAGERELIRKNLLDSLLRTDVAELRNMLAEVLRIIATADYPQNWPDLVPALGREISARASKTSENNPKSLENLLVAIHQLTRPFECFRNASGRVRAVTECSSDRV
jgi:hypothetical protein